MFQCTGEKRRKEKDGPHRFATVFGKLRQTPLNTLQNIYHSQTDGYISESWQFISGKKTTVFISLCQRFLCHPLTYTVLLTHFVSFGNKSFKRRHIPIPIALPLSLSPFFSISFSHSLFLSLIYLLILSFWDLPESSKWQFWAPSFTLVASILSNTGTRKGWGGNTQMSTSVTPSVRVATWWKSREGGREGGKEGRKEEGIKEGEERCIRWCQIGLWWSCWFVISV